MGKGKRIRSHRGDDPMDDEIHVIFPSPVPPHEPVTDVVLRREFLGRLDGTTAADQMRQAGRDIRVVALVDVEALQQWLATRAEG